MTLSNLGRPNWYDGIQMAGTHASDDTRTNEHFVVDAASLQGTSNKAVACTHEDDFYSAQFVT